MLDCEYLNLLVDNLSSLCLGYNYGLCGASDFLLGLKRRDTHDVESTCERLNNCDM